MRPWHDNLVGFPGELGLILSTQCLHQGPGSAYCLLLASVGVSIRVKSYDYLGSFEALELFKSHVARPQQCKDS